MFQQADLFAPFEAASSLGSLPDLIDRISQVSKRPRYAFMVLNLIYKAVGQGDSIGPYVRYGDDLLPVRDWLCEARIPLAQRDGRRRTLDTDVLVIEDAERASAIAGVMGGADSEVAMHTSKIVLEAAWFDPRSIRATSKRLGIRTEASYRYERGADVTAPLRAMARALSLIEITGGVPTRKASMPSAG